MNIYVHHLSPFALRFTENFGIRWYGLAYLSGFILGYLAIREICRRGRSILTTDMAADFVTYVAIGVLVGGRLGYCLFYQPDLFISFNSSFPYWGLLKVNEGGMASHGGIFAVVFVCFLFGRAKKISFLHLMDLCVFGGSLGFFFGRIANFINGELYGRPAPAGLTWAVKFPQEMYLWSEREISKLFQLGPAAEALGSLHPSSGPAIPVNASIWQTWVSHYPADVTSRAEVQMTIEQLIQATQNGNAKVLAALAAVLTPRYPSQLIQAGLEGASVFVILCLIWIRPRKPGVLAAWFGILYAIARIIGEQFRMPDVQIGFQLWGLTRGQWLSIGQLALGILMLTWVSRRDAEPMGGFTRGGIDP